MDKAEQYRIHEEMFERIKTMCDDLSEWEADFVVSAHDGMRKYGSLTEKQAESLERIYDKKFGKHWKRRYE